MPRARSCPTSRAAEALAAWLAAVPGRLRGRRARAGRCARPRDRRADLGAALLARVRRRRDGRHRGARRGHLRRDRDRAAQAARDFAVVDTGDALPDGLRRGRHARAAPLGGRRARGRSAAAAPWQHVRTIGEDVSATELLLPEGHRLRPVDLAAAAAAGHTSLTVRRAPHVIVIPTGDEVRPLGSDPAPGRARRHQLADARRAGARGRLHASSRSPSSRTTPRGSAPRVADAAAPSRPRDRDRRLERRARRLHRRRARAGRARCSCTASPSSPAIPSCSAPWTAPRCSARPGYPVSAALTFDIFAIPLLAALEGAAPVERPARARPARAPAGLLARRRRLDPRPPRPRRRRARRDAAAARRRRPHLARARRRPARRARRARRPRRRRARSRCGCCATSTPSSARSSRSARTTRCSTSPPRCCAPATRCRRS